MAKEPANLPQKKTPAARRPAAGNHLIALFDHYRVINRMTPGQRKFNAAANVEKYQTIIAKLSKATKKSRPTAKKGSDDDGH